MIRHLAIPLLVASLVSALSNAEADSDVFGNWVLTCQTDFVTEQRTCEIFGIEKNHDASTGVRIGILPKLEMFGILVAVKPSLLANPPSIAYLRVDDNSLIVVQERISFLELAAAWAAYVGGTDLTDVPEYQKYAKSIAARGTPEDQKHDPQKGDIMAIYRDILRDGDIGFTLNEFGLWVVGEAAEDLLTQFRSGNVFRVRLVDSHKVETDMEFSLIGFTAAHKAYLTAMEL